MFYVLGSNMGSQLAHPPSQDDTHIPIPHTITPSKTACGVMHTLILLNESVYSWGCNDECALGRDGPEHEILPVSIPRPVICITAGGSHSTALTKDGVLYAWGTFRDTGGVVGFSSRVRLQKRPAVIARNIVRVVSADNYIAMVNEKGSVYCYGPGLYKTRVDRRRAAVKQCTSSMLRLVMRGGRVNPRFESLYAGSNHCFGTAKGKVYAWGNNNCGQLGTGNKTSHNEIKYTGLDDVIFCSGGDTHSLFLKKDGSLYVCGINTDGQLGIGKKEVLAPEAVMVNVQRAVCRGTNSLAVKEDGVYAWGGNYYGELGFEEGASKTPRKVGFNFGQIIELSAGNNHTVVVTTNNN